MLGPPPPPLLTEGGDELTAFSSTGETTGAFLRVYRNVDNGPPWSLFRTAPLFHEVDIGPREVLDGFAYYVTEVGDGVGYVGESSPSNVIDWS